MPLFSIAVQRLSRVEQTNFSAEKALQSLIEKNLQEVFNCRFVASEHPTGAQHAGRIDTLALSEDDNPVIIFEQHLASKPEKIKTLALAVHDFVVGLDPSIEAAPKKFYIAYKISQNIVCLETNKQKVTLYLKLNPKELSNPPRILRDVSRIGHYGTGDVEVTLKSEQDLEIAKPFIEMAYRKVGG